MNDNKKKRPKHHEPDSGSHYIFCSFTQTKSNVSGHGCITHRVHHMDNASKNHIHNAVLIYRIVMDLGGFPRPFTTGAAAASPKAGKPKLPVRCYCDVAVNI